MTEFKKVLFYNNYYSKKDESIEITFNIEEGFATKEKAVAAIKESGQIEEEFSYVIFKNMFYPVSICNIDEEIVIAKEYIWYKEYAYGGIKKFHRKLISNPPYVINNARVHSRWTNSLMDILKEIDPQVDCRVASKVKAKSYMRENCMIVFICAMFDTMIPVFKLNCVDEFFSYPPSFMRLWEDGIMEFNPFSEDRIYKKKGVPYTYDDYIAGK